MGLTWGTSPSTQNPYIGERFFKMSRSTCVLRMGIALLVAGAASAQTTTPAPDPAPSPTPAWSAGPIDFSGLVDGYYSLNFNHPATKNNNWRNFDAKANQFSLNMAKLTMEHSADPVGFKFELAAGRAMEIFHSTEPAGIEVYKHVLQAYVSFKPTNLHGVQFDFGKFVTSAGAEVTETHLNWNYSRSLLFANGPYYHFGLRRFRACVQKLQRRFPVGERLEQRGGQQCWQDRRVNDRTDHLQNNVGQQLLCGQ